MTETRTWIRAVILLLIGLPVLGQEKEDEFEKFCRAYAEKAKERKAFTAKLRVKTLGKIEDFASFADGRVCWKAVEGEGPWVLWESKERDDKRARKARTLIKGDEATVIEGDSHRPVVYDLGETKRFFPAWVVRTGPVKEWRDRYDVSIVARPSDTALPEKVISRDGQEPRPVRRVKASRGSAAGGRASPSNAGRYTVLRLKPREDDESPVESVLVCVSKEEMRIERIVIETPMRSVIVRITGHEEPESLDDSVFDLGLGEK